MFVTIINDCRDANAAGRQATRASASFGVGAAVIGVRNDLEAAGNLIDALDASGGSEGVILVNVAPRNGKAKKWKNGTPFGSFTFGRTIVVASVDGITLSLVKKLGLSDEVRIFDIPEVMDWAVAAGELSKDEGDRISNTQFRSFDFLPRCASWVWRGLTPPSAPLPLEGIPIAPEAVWWTDNFGNCKTTVLEEEADGGSLAVDGLGIARFDRLKDVPDGVLGCVAGSSGVGDRRFLEIVRQGGNAAETLGIGTGHSVTLLSPQQVAGVRASVLTS